MPPMKISTAARLPDSVWDAVRDYLEDREDGNRAIVCADDDDFDPPMSPEEWEQRRADELDQDLRVEAARTPTEQLVRDVLEIEERVTRAAMKSSIAREDPAYRPFLNEVRQRLGECWQDIPLSARPKQDYVLHIAAEWGPIYEELVAQAQAYEASFLHPDPGYMLTSEEEARNRRRHMHARAYWTAAGEQDVIARNPAHQALINRGIIVAIAIDRQREIVALVQIWNDVVSHRRTMEIPLRWDLRDDAVAQLSAVLDDK